MWRPMWLSIEMPFISATVSLMATYRSSASQTMLPRGDAARSAAPNAPIRSLGRASFIHPTYPSLALTIPRLGAPLSEIGCVAQQLAWDDLSAQTEQDLLVHTERSVAVFRQACPPSFWEILE
jgi:hypothetical protein